MTSFNLRALKLRSGEQYQDEVEVQLSPLEFGGQRYLPVPDKVPAELRATRASTGTVFELSFQGRLHGPCQRCLRDTVIDRHVRPASTTRRARTPTRSSARRTSTTTSSTSRHGRATRSRSTCPEQILHDPDCAGLCPVCGKDLNEEPHTHEEKRVDPRWARSRSYAGSSRVSVRVGSNASRKRRSWVTSTTVPS